MSAAQIVKQAKLDSELLSHLAEQPALAYRRGMLHGLADTMMKAANALEEATGKPKATKRQIKKARTTFCLSDKIAVYDDAGVSVADEGVWVEGWLWLPNKKGDE